MLTRLRRAMEDKDQGFTLIELLVVIIIIGILAAIAIPVFLNQRKKGVDAGMKSDLRAVAIQMETYYTTASLYPATAPTQSGNIVTVGTEAVYMSPNTSITIVYNAGATAYCIVNTSNGSASKNWVYVSNRGGVQLSGTYTTACPAAGSVF